MDINKLHKNNILVIWIGVAAMVFMTVSSYISYDVKIAIKDDGYMPSGDKTGHCFAIVKLSGGWVGIETKQSVINTSKSIGKVIGITSIREICDNPDDVYSRDIRKKHMIGNFIEKN